MMNSYDNVEEFDAVSEVLTIWRLDVYDDSRIVTDSLLFSNQRSAERTRTDLLTDDSLAGIWAITLVEVPIDDAAVSEFWKRTAEKEV
jgi:hypothetical protein